MPEYLYEVRLSGGQTHPEWNKFYENVNKLNGKSPDDSINSVVLVKHSQNKETVHLLVSDGFTNEEDVTVDEITSLTLTNIHIGYNRIVESYFSPYSTFHNL